MFRSLCEVESLRTRPLCTDSTIHTEIRSLVLEPSEFAKNFYTESFSPSFSSLHITYAAFLRLNESDSR